MLLQSGFYHILLIIYKHCHFLTVCRVDSHDEDDLSDTFTVPFLFCILLGAITGSW